MTVVISIIGVFQPHRCISWIYRQALDAWVTASPLYAPGLHGFLYLPTGALIYGPFALIPQPLDSYIWRLFLSVALVAAVRRYTAMLIPGTGLAAAGTVLALAIPAAAIDLLRGQMTLLMIAVLLVATVEAAAGRNRRAGLLLALSVVVKPLALIPAMLILVAVPHAGLGFVAGLALGILVGLLHPDPNYAITQWVAVVEKLRTASAPDTGTWFDVGAVFKRLGWIGPSEQLFALRSVAALATLMLAMLASHRFATRIAVILCLHLGVCYLLLWNPRVEEGSYVMLALLAGGQFLIASQTPGGKMPAGFTLVLCLALGTHMYGDWVYRPTATWIKQLMAMAWMLTLAGAIAFPKALLSRLSAFGWAAVYPFQASENGSSAGLPCCQLGPVVADHQPRLAASGDQGAEFTGNAGAGQRGVGHQRQTLACEVIHHR
ncbi:hypothetical protein TSO352_23075 [Azospirillum sp. TSO35-2]|nr:hypothetical protein TSO352_23075 [Azospirillum sp. TSO35-2]